MVDLLPGIKHLTHIKYYIDKYPKAHAFICCLEKKTTTAKDKNITVIYPWELLYRLGLQ